MADKSYNSRGLLVSVREAEVRPYIAEPNFGRRKSPAPTSVSQPHFITPSTASIQGDSQVHCVAVSG